MKFSQPTTEQIEAALPETDRAVTVADVVAAYVACVGVRHVFTVTGGGAMYLNDAFLRVFGTAYIPVHHEQAASMASESYARSSGGFAVCQVTTGPGVTNAITGAVGAWIDSVPVIFISGQVESFSLLDVGLRQSGVQEVDTLSLVKPFTKFAQRLDIANDVLRVLDEAACVARLPRTGPVWIDIPLDIQNAVVEVAELPRYVTRPPHKRRLSIINRKIKLVSKKLAASKRPVLLLGAGARDYCLKTPDFAEKFALPIVTGWNAKDLIPYDSRWFVGSAGLFGDRAANFCVQNADLLLGLGYRFSVPQVGYDPSTYGREAEIVAVDIDPKEGSKLVGFIDLHVQADCTEFAEVLAGRGHCLAPEMDPNWVAYAQSLKRTYGFLGGRDANTIDSFDFTEKLSEKLDHRHFVVTDMGTSFTCTHQAIKITRGLGLHTSSGLAAMGFGLPGAIGASLGSGRLTLCITGDGGLMFNLQELQTIKTQNLNVRIVTYNNAGYLTMRQMQRSRFNRLVGEGKGSNLEVPDFAIVATAFGVESRKVGNFCEIDAAVDWLLDDSFRGPRLLEVMLDSLQELTPRVQTNSDSAGNLFPGVLEDMHPLLPQAEFERDMIIKSLPRPK